MHKQVLVVTSFAVVFAASFLVLVGSVRAEKAEDDTADLTALSIEELMDIEVTSVSKKEERLFEAASAVYVITQEDIRRSGATSIPEVLRMVPGLHVARMTANVWSVTSRGFNGRFANKLLVLLDGRSVYTPLFSGVYWEQKDTLLEDIDRIEVIRGPGATLWGANAVNGVINIITKSAAETQGGLVTAGGGSEEQGFGGLRYGGKLGEDAYFRVYAKYFNRDDAIDGFGDSTADEWDVLRGGARIDWDISESDSLTVQGDVYGGDLDQTMTAASLRRPFSRSFDDVIDVAGGNLLARWNHGFSETSDSTLQLYYDRTDRDDTLMGEVRDTFDLDFQHRFGLGERQEIVWGLGYRLTMDDVDNTFGITLAPSRRGDHLFSAFVQDEITLVEDRVRLTLGSKFEHNDYTGFEVQPSARVLWTPHERHTVWGSVSRAVRTPSRAEHDVRLNNEVLSLLPGLPPIVMAMIGDSGLDSEDLLAYEIGYRVQPLHRLSFDIAAFYNVYDGLRGLGLGMPFLEVSPLPIHLVVPAYGENNMDGETYGIEIGGNWMVLDWWRLRAAYTCLEMDVQLGEDILALFLPAGAIGELLGEAPQHQFSLRSTMDLPANIEFDWWFRYVDELPVMGVDSYVTLDLRLGWEPIENLEFSIVGQNLLDNHHSEYTGGAFVNTKATEVERSVYGKVTWRF